MPKRQQKTPTLGQRIKTARETAGLTQAVLAERLGTSVASVSQLECDRYEPSLPRLREIARAIGVEAGSLL